ncbi:hypothetical protein [Nocardia asiatica]|uniref:hypothetical protein n=1 Tax=Nocardia asiatica TaxID=209252 RepID=UPI0012F86D68|nr:hypothetical protein [Nocardia asiatica]
MAFQVGDLVQVRVSPVSTFQVLEVDVDGDPNLVLVIAGGQAPGRYPYHYRASDLAPAQGMTTADTSIPDPRD